MKAYIDEEERNNKAEGHDFEFRYDLAFLFFVCFPELKEDACDECSQDGAYLEERGEGCDNESDDEDD